MQCFFHFFFGEHKFSVELHGNLRLGTSLISMEQVIIENYEHVENLLDYLQNQENVDKCVVQC